MRFIGFTLSVALLFTTVCGAIEPAPTDPTACPERTRGLGSVGDPKSGNPHLDAILKTHPDMAKWAVLKELPWASAQRGTGIYASLLSYGTSPMPFGNQSTWKVEIAPDGKLNIHCSFHSSDAPAAKVKSAFSWAESTIDAPNPKQSSEGAFTKLAINGIVDHDMAPSETNCAQGRRIYLERMYEGFSGKKLAAPIDVATAVPNLEKILRANLVLGTKLARPLATGAVADKANFFFSPYSIGTAWTMATAGASDAARKEMLTLYGNSGLSAEDFVTGNGALRKVLFSGPSQSLVSANSLWVNQGIELKTAYQTFMDSELGALVTQLNFGSPSAVTTINDRVSKDTFGLIPKLLDRTSASDLVYLINTVALKVQWKDKFDADPVGQPFLMPDGKHKSIPTMYKTGKFNYMRNGSAEGVSLDTADGEVAIDLFLPNSALSAADIAKSIDLEEVSGWSKEFESDQQGILLLPKLKLEYGHDLVSTIAGLEPI
jgi:serine protease inhibitor